MGSLLRLCLIALIALFAAASLAACEREEEEPKREPSPEDISVIQTEDEEFAQEKRVFEQDMRERIQALDRDIAELQRRLATMPEETREEVRAAVRELSDERRLLERRLQEARETTVENWDDFERALKAAMDDLERRVDERLHQLEPDRV